MRRLTILVFFILLSCSKDSPIPDAVVTTPEPTITKFTLAVAASEGGGVNTSGGTYNENTNVSVTATPAEGYAFSGWSGDASGSTNPLSVSITGNKDITASFIRLQYSLGVNIIGSGTVSQVLVESTEKNTDYDSFSTVRLTATPETGWIFYGWSGSTTETTSEIDVVMEGTKAVTATFEEQLNQVIGVDDVFFGIGKWKIRKPKGSSGSGNTVDESSKQMLANCEISSIIFRTDGSFTIATGTTTVTGQFIIDSNTTISLTQAQSPFGTITNLVLTNNFISFSIQLADGCSEETNGERDGDYNEDTDTSLPPVISLVGESIINIELGSTFTDPGATATDNIDGDLTSSITASGTVNTATEGTYTIVYSVSDADGNIASVSRTVIVSLDLPPTITLTGSSTITLLVGDTYIENGCVATDNEDGDLTSSIITTGTVDTSTVGTYTLVYSITDSASNIVSTTRTVIVNSSLDTTPPVITLTGSSTINLNVGDNWQDTGGTANDNVDGDLTFSMSASYPVDSTFSSVSEYNTLTFTATGTYIITYSVSDAAGNTTTVDRIIIVSAISNTTACTISGQNIGGGQSQTVTLTNAISDITFTVNSSCQENLQEEVLGLPTGVTMNFSDNTAIISGTPTGQTGDYSYVVNWYSSTSSFTLGGTITVVAGSTTSTSTTSSTTADTTAPVITLTGSSTINLTVGETFTDPGATATDDVDGDLTSSISITDPGAFTSTAGTYTISYSVSDAAGNAATVVQRTIIVSVAADTTAPVITLVGASTLLLGTIINLTVGDVWVDPGATATDDVDGDLTSSISVSGSVDTSSTGTYTLSYNVSDAAGNAATQVERTIIVSAAADTTPPVITLTGSSTINLNVGDTFTDPGATATDDIDGNITSSISISGSVDTSTAGTYTLSYNVSDAAGNAATEVQRTITVQ
ncbi:DUF5011 domain-containing protein [Flavobacteriaceae bacterium]|nr:DUF5011 domain-containing protein [Flavobacteriaceae bacterium]MDC1522488.1 DUF5011 domain-containing protein [Flavobacteriaceae bacterium]